MIVEREYYVKLSEIGKENKITNKALLGILEDIGGVHSNIAGYGIPTMDKTHLTWILLDWKVQVLKRPKYGQKLNVKTWGRTMKRTYTYRDFEMYDEENNLCVIGTSKWVLIDIKTGRISKITEEIYEKYQIEEKNVFNIEELDKLKEPEEYSSEMEYKVCRRDIDLNGHMHNLYYLDLAYEVLPEKVYEQRPFDNFRIQYKKEVKLGDVVKCRYTFKDGEHIVSIFNSDGSRVHAIIVLK